MSQKPKDGAPGTSEQSPRWEGPKANRPRGYLPAKDDPDQDRDAAGENNQDQKRDLGDALKQKNDDLPEEDDDNPYQESDEILPDDDEEAAMRRDMSGRGARYKPG